VLPDSEQAAPDADHLTESLHLEVRIPAREKKGLVREFVRLQSNDPMRSTLSLYLVAYSVSKEQLKELFDKYKTILN